MDDRLKGLPEVAKDGDEGTSNKQSMLHMADPELLNMEVVDADGLTRLHLAAQEGHLSLVKYLIEHHANVHAKVKRPVAVDGEAKFEGATCLHIAALQGHERVVKYLLHNGADTDILEADCRGDTALHAAALTNKSHYTIRDLLNHLQDSRTREKKIVEIVDVPGEKKRTPLHYAAGLGDVEKIKVLLKAGANPSKTDDLGATPLHYAARGAAQKNMDALKILINNEQSDVRKKDNNGKTAIEWAVNVDAFLLLEENIRDNTQRTALHWATVMGKLEMVRQLCEKKKTSSELLKANAEDIHGKTALQYAKEMHHEDIETVLLELEEVRRYESRLYRDRQVYVDAANAVLVGAALIASVTFAGWLQPPLSYMDYYNLPPLPSPSSLPDQFQSYAGLQQHVGLRAFWVFNSLSFSFAIATIIASLLGVIPSRNVFIGTTVLFLRKTLLVAVIFLAFSIVCVLAAFTAAGFTVLPPIFKYQANMMSTVIVGGTPCIVLLAWLVYRLWLAARPDNLDHSLREDEQQKDKKDRFLDMIDSRMQQ